METKWKRMCPTCNKILFYKRKGTLVFANKNHHICRKCYYKSRLVSLERRCPKCDDLIVYTTYNGMYLANKNNTLCKKCRKFNHDKGKELQDFFKICKCGRKLKYKEKWLLDRSIRNKSKCHKCMRIGKYHTEKTKKKIAKSKLNNPNKKETSRKQRLSAIERIKNRDGVCHPNYNLDACKYFDKVEKENGWDGFYATKGGEYQIKELGYFVDFYEPNKNIVIEYDEPKHFVGSKLKNRDVFRMNEIKTILHCRFFRYNSMIKELKEY